MNYKKTLFIIITLVFFSLLPLSADSDILEDKLFSFDSKPTIGKTTALKLHIEDENLIDKLYWVVLKEPKKSTLILEIIKSKNEVVFSPSLSGVYIIEVRVEHNGILFRKNIQFNVKEGFPFNMDSLNPIDEKDDSSRMIAKIENQSWVLSRTLEKEELETLIKGYDRLEIIGYDKVYGVLISYDTNNVRVKDDLEDLKTQIGVDDVYNRIYEGENAFEPNMSLPNIGGAL